MIHLNAPQVEKAVRELCGKNGNIFLSQVRNGTGFERRQVRTADMLAISTWPSRGLYAEGYEVKVSKSDLASEIANPAKAEEIAQYCTYWWIAGPEGIADNVGLPDNWGLITINEKLKAKVAVAAKRLQPKAMDTLFVCAVLRSFSESHVHKDQVAPLIAAAREKAKDEASSRLKHRLDELEKGIASFKEYSGIDLLSAHNYIRYDLQDVGQAIDSILKLRSRPVEELRRTKEALRAGEYVIDEALAMLTKVREAEQSA